MTNQANICRLRIDGNPLVEVHVHISGRAQGVGFCYFTKGAADQMNVYGYVKSLPDGRVEAVLEGWEADVSKMLEKLRVGPQTAKVTDVKMEERDSTGGYEDCQTYR